MANYEDRVTDPHESGKEVLGGDGDNATAVGAQAYEQRVSDNDNPEGH